MKKTLLNPAKSEHCELDNSSISASIIQLELYIKTPDTETVELINDSEYIQRLEMLWGDSEEWL